MEVSPWPALGGAHPSHSSSRRVPVRYLRSVASTAKRPNGAVHALNSLHTSTATSEVPADQKLSHYLYSSFYHPRADARSFVCPASRQTPSPWVERRHLPTGYKRAFFPQLFPWTLTLFPLLPQAVAPPQRLGSCSFVDVLLCVFTFYRLNMVFETVLFAMWLCSSLEDFLHIGRGASFLSIPRAPRLFYIVQSPGAPHHLGNVASAVITVWVRVAPRSPPSCGKLAAILLVFFN